MLDAHLTEDHVQAVIADLGGHRGDLAASAWMSLTAGEGPEMLSLSGLQNWAWWLLPKRSHGSDDYDWWVESVDAAAALFDRLGAGSYAQLCRSETTAKVLAAWRESRAKGVAAAQRALAASPVEPPDLDDFTWGTVFGTWESDARTAVERTLEAALVEGRLDSEARSWRKTAAAICADTLDRSHPGKVGQSWRTLVLTERAEQWAAGPGVPAERREARYRTASRYLSAPEPPDPAAIAHPMGLLAWFASSCADGATLTASGYLPRALVLEAVDRHGWWDWDKAPRSEADVWELRLVHRAAQALRIVRRRGRVLTTTKAGSRIGTEPLAWWPRLALLGQGENDYRDAIFEAAALALMDGATHDVDELSLRIGEELAEQRWQTEGRRLSATEHGHHLYMAINPWRVWGFVDYRSSRWEPTPDGPRRIQPTTVAATPAGTSAAALWLHHRITGPRSSI